MKFIDYAALAILTVIGAARGVWTGLKQIPGYVRAEIRSARHRVHSVVRARETGKTERQRRIEARSPKSLEREPDEISEKVNDNIWDLF